MHLTGHTIGNFATATAISFDRRIDGVLVCDRPSDGRPWASPTEDDLGFSVADLQRGSSPLTEARSLLGGAAWPII
ncbi:hypothetical protein QFZ34_001343 [Phyllobacterium ifriqiyense]|uniref:Uncharacterized protein n=1 Tax=Phyllobacterium ifriqiyense TaxID=314238 RepID=A0ABU0S5Y1_9HYPH|nr:hypothetical protein [Phyllobacterium ifriqiyense]